jgi:copper chaperone CopZ
MFGLGGKKEKFTVDGMTCHHCEMTVERYAAMVPGVKSAKADRTTHTLEVVESGPIDIDILREKIQEAGYSMK